MADIMVEIYRANGCLYPPPLIYKTINNDMAYFKIKNITNNLGKRHPRFNTPQIIETKGLLSNDKTTIHPGHEIIVESEFLPVSAQQLRLKGFLIIQEINKNEYLKHVKVREAQILAEEASIKALEEPAKIEEYKEKSKKSSFRNKE